MLERTDELYEDDVLSNVEEWDKKIQDTTNDCLDKIVEHCKGVIDYLDQEKLNKLTKRPGSNQCKGKYYDGQTTWGDLYVDNYSYVEYCVNKNYFNHLNYDINSWFYTLGKINRKREKIEECLRLLE